MSIYMDKARELREDETKHYNCAQAVLIPFCQLGGIEEETANRLASNFGAGMKMGATCGAITGGLMALGLLGIDDRASVNGYYRALRKNHRALDCATLLKLNYQQGREKKPHCDDMVYECVGLVEDILAEHDLLER